MEGPPPDGRRHRPVGRLAIGFLLAGLVAAVAVAVGTGEGPGADVPPIGEVIWTSHLGRQTHLDLRGRFVDQWSWVLEAAATDAAGLYVPLPAHPRVWGMHALDTGTGATRWADLQTGGQVLAGEGVLVRLSGTGALSLIDPATGEHLQRLQVEGSVAFDVAVTAGTVVARDRDHHRVHGFDVLTGAERWHRPIDEEGLVLAAGDGLILLTNRWRDPSVTVLDAVTGEEQWSLAAPLTEVDAGVVAHGRVLLSGRPEPLERDDGGSTLALDARTGVELWRHAMAPWWSATGLPHTDGIVVLGDTNRLQGVAVEDGQVRWEAPGSWVVHARSVGYGRINGWTGTTPDAGGMVVALDAATGAQLWRRPAGQERPSGLLVLVGPVESYVWAPDGLAAVDGRTGAVRWRYDRLDELLPLDGLEPSCLPGAGHGGVYASGSDGLVAHDAATGERRWAYLPFAAGRRSFGVPVAGDEALAVLSSGGGRPQRTSLHVLDASWGGLQSSRELHGFASGPPVVHGRDVYVAGAFQEGALLRIHARTGRLWWRQRVDGRVLASPAVSGETVYVPTTRALFALDVATGEVSWSRAFEHLLAAPPIVADGVVAVVDGGSLVALDATSGLTRWTVEFSEVPTHAAVAVGPRVVVATEGGRVAAFDLDDGAERWRRQLADEVVGAPVVVGDRIALVSRGGLVLAFDAATGESAGSVGVRGPHLGELAADGDTIFACSADGTLHAIR